jgi:tRNA dimethylallyltransferase
MNRHPAGYLHRVLEKMDPEAASKIAAQDEQKLIRAIEVCLLTKRPLSEVHREGRNPLQGWRILKLGLQPDREALYERIHARTDSMLARGWMNEVCGLIASGLPETAKPFQFIGYRELREVTEGRQKLETARASIQQATRQYAKRQLTWFRREQAIHWLPGFGDEVRIQNDSLQWLRRKISI